MKWDCKRMGRQEKGVFIRSGTQEGRCEPMMTSTVTIWGAAQAYSGALGPIVAHLPPLFALSSFDVLLQDWLGGPDLSSIAFSMFF